MEIVVETGTYQAISSSTAVLSGPGYILGIFVTAASDTPTLKVWDSLSAAGGVVADTWTPAAGTFYPIPARVGTGIYVTISGTVACTVIYKTSP